MNYEDLGFNNRFNKRIKKNTYLSSLDFDALIEDGSVIESKIFNGAITTEKLALSAIGTDQLKENSVTDTILAALSVVADKLANDSVSSAAIQSGAVTAVKIANLAVGNAAIQNAAVTNAKIANVSADKITTSTLDVAVDVGSGTGYVRLDGVNNRILVNDGTNNRIVIGDV